MNCTEAIIKPEAIPDVIARIQAGNQAARDLYYNAVYCCHLSWARNAPVMFEVTWNPTGAFGMHLHDIAQDDAHAALSRIDAGRRAYPFTRFAKKATERRVRRVVLVELRMATVPIDPEQLPASNPCVDLPPLETMIDAYRKVASDDDLEILLRRAAGLSFKAIGLALKRNPGTLRSRISRLTAKLREHFSDPRDDGWSG
ncbi:MAG: hypothetical protein KGK12_09870 [Armatimonadetes bacterium]|nr:hypothetical protein [Armatimonadota bacterium]